MGASPPVVPCDVVIIGGGPQGLWLLELLKDKKYSCLLLERQSAGAGQSAHAEWFMHRGHVLKSNYPFLSDLPWSAQAWEHRIKDKGLQSHISPAQTYVAFMNADPDKRFVSGRGQGLSPQHPPFPRPF